MPQFAAEDLRRLGQDLFTTVGVPADEAALVADHMVESGLLGHDSHSVLRFPQYTDMVRTGKVTPGAPLEILREHDSVVQVNGNWNYGPVTATRATELAIERVKDRAMSVVTVRGCNHVARLGRFVHMVAQHAPQGGVQQMGGGVVAHDGAAALHIHVGVHLVAHFQGTAAHGAHVDVRLAALAGVFHVEAGIAGDEHAPVAHLAATL